MVATRTWIASGLIYVAESWNFTAQVSQLFFLLFFSHFDKVGVTYETCIHFWKCHQVANVFLAACLGSLCWKCFFLLPPLGVCLCFLIYLIPVLSIVSFCLLGHLCRYLMGIETWKVTFVFKPSYSGWCLVIIYFFLSQVRLSCLLSGNQSPIFQICLLANVRYYLSWQLAQS